MDLAPFQNDYYGPCDVDAKKLASVLDAQHKALALATKRLAVQEARIRALEDKVRDLLGVNG